MESSQEGRSVEGWDEIVQYKQLFTLLVIILALLLGIFACNDGKDQVAVPMFTHSSNYNAGL